MDQIVMSELRRRCDLLIENSSPDTIENGMTGSLVRFNMGLNILGTNTDPPSWWDEEYKKPCMDLETFHSPVYDDYIGKLFDEAYYKVNAKKNK